MNPTIHDIGKSVILGLATIGTTKLLLLIGGWIKNFIIESRFAFEITGYWVAVYKDLRTQEFSTEHREIVRILQKGESLFFQYEHHNSSNSLVTRGDGRGFIRGNEAYLYYRRYNMGGAGGGVLILTIQLSSIRMLSLDGIFIELNRTNSGERTVSVPYRLERVELPLYRKLRMLCRKQALGSFGEVARLGQLK